MRISDWSSDVCSSDLAAQLVWLAGRSAKNAKSPGIRYCGRERGDTSPAHSGQKDRVFDPENFAYAALRSEEHTSELQSLISRSYAVFCLKQKNMHTALATDS